MRKSIILLPAFLAGCVVIPIAAIPNPNLPATAATASHVPAQSQNFSVAAGGNINASVVNSSCNGFVAEAPDISIDNSTLAGLIALDIAVTAAGGDTTLLVHTPGGAWLCNDDASGFNPALHITSPVNGQYDIWVGTFAPGGFISTTVRVY